MTYGLTEIVPLVIDTGEAAVTGTCRACVQEKHRGVQPAWARSDDQAEVSFSATVGRTEESGIVFCSHGHPHPWRRGTP